MVRGIGPDTGSLESLIGREVGCAIAGMAATAEVR